GLDNGAAGPRDTDGDIAGHADIDPAAVAARAAVVRVVIRPVALGAFGRGPDAVDRHVVAGGAVQHQHAGLVLDAHRAAVAGLAVADAAVAALRLGAQQRHLDAVADAQLLADAAGQRRAGKIERAAVDHPHFAALAAGAAILVVEHRRILVAAVAALAGGIDAAHVI